MKRQLIILFTLALSSLAFGLEEGKGNHCFNIFKYCWITSLSLLSFIVLFGKSNVN